MSQPIPPEADKPRLVISYSGMNVYDAREHIRLVLKGTPPRGLRWCLKDAGFHCVADATWQRPNTPDAIFQAQSIGTIFFAKQEKP